MILSEVEEIVTTVEVDEETYEEMYKVCLSCVFINMTDCMYIVCTKACKM